jgi:hypothetical protein
MHPIVIEPHQLDHFVDVGFCLDLARRRPRLPGEDRVIDHSALLLQLRPQLLAEEEVRGAVAVQVTDLVAADPEAVLAPPPVARLDSGPGGDLLGYSLTRCS